jgi:hypothetical protein
MRNKITSAPKKRSWGDLPPDFADVLRSLSALKSTMKLKEITAPNVARHAVAIDAYLEPDSATGRFVVLYDAEKTQLWGSALRVVTYIEADLSADFVKSEEFTDDVFARFEFYLQKTGASLIGGTITTTTDRHYGNYLDKFFTGHQPISTIEARISWTPQIPDIAGDFLAFEKMMYLTAQRQYIAKPSILQ